ncbi:MAG: BNR-4 repeat-containing protein [Candidatus Latescibacteria bacterium]|nr:BNR-4 repeat-containing protein [Candidatus Latescibacterota bacterium]
MEAEPLNRMTALDVADPSVADPERGDALLSRIAGERASQGVGNKIVSRAGKTHFAWQDSYDQRYFARVRTLDHDTGKWSASAVLSEGVDEHSRPALAADSEGFLHVVMGGHNSPLQYQRSLRPHDSSAWSAIESFGRNTYPVLLCGPDDTLYLTVRDGGHEGLELWERPPGGVWQSHGLVVARQERFSGYTGMSNDMAWGPGQKTVHMSMAFFLSRKPEAGEHPRDVSGRYQAVGYMRSHDFGRTWQKADGTPIALPGTSDTVDLLDEGESDNPKPGIEHCGQVVDSEGRPYVGYVRHTPTPCRVSLVTPRDEGGWRGLPLHETVEKHWPGWAMYSFKMVMTADDVLCILGEIVPLDHPDANWSPGIHGLPFYWLRDHVEISRIVWLESSDYGETFTSRDVLEFDPAKGQVLPSIERANSSHPIPAGTRPSFLYTLGESRYAHEGETIDNELYWVRVEAESETQP